MKKTIGVLLAGMLTVSCGAGSVSAVDANTSQMPITVATWANTYSSMDTMLNESDAVIVGTVESQTVKQVDELYFTHSFVQDQSGNTYEVVQTGAIVNGVEKNVPVDVTLLENGEDYFFALNEKDNTYYIAGGTQGVGDFDAQTNTVSSLNINNRSLYSSMKISNPNNSIDILNIEYPLMTASDPDLDPYYCIWHIEEVTYYIHPISSSFEGNIYNDIYRGIESWDGLSSISLSQSNSSTDANVRFLMGDFYTADWVGLTQYTSYSDYMSQCVLEEVYIRLNYAYDQQNVFDKFWQAIACHEMGHALGLTHNSSSKHNVMNGEIYGWILKGEEVYQPSSNDIDALRQKYSLY